MAMNRPFEEAIRLYLETSGDEELKKLVNGLGDLGDVAEKEAGTARDAMQRFADVLANMGRVDAFAATRRQIQATEEQLDAAQQKAQKLAKELAGSDKPNATLERQQRAAAKAVNDLNGDLQRQRVQLQQQRRELTASGVDTRKLGSAQGELRRQLTGARGALTTAVEGVRAYRTEAAAAGRDVPAANARIAKSYDGIGGALGKLRALAAPVLAFLTFRSAAGGVKALAAVQQQAEDARRALSEMYGSQEAGNKAFGQLEVLAKRNGLAIGEIVEQAKRMKAFGIDPLNGSLQALIDQNAAAGGSMEDLSGKVLAVGQAWAKQKLQGEEILQLVERGVPVWDLLQKATGKNVQELQKLSEAGKLGRDVIAQLMEEIGRANAGAANRSLGSLSGLLAQTSARWLEFKNQVVSAGLGDYLKEQLGAVLGSTGDMAGVAKRVSDAIVSSMEALKRFGQQLAPVASAIGNGTLALGRNAEALLLLAKVYAVMKIASVAQQFSLLTRAKLADAAASHAAAAATGTHAAAATGLGGVLSRLPKVVRIGIAVAGVDWAIDQMLNLHAVLKDRAAAAEQVEQVERRQLGLQQEQLAMGQQLQQVYLKYSDVAIKSASDLSAITRDQAKDYQFALEQARQFYGGVIREARATGDAQAEATALERWRALGDAVTAVKTRVTELGAVSASATGIRTFVDGAVAKFDQLITKSKDAKAAINGAFDGIDLTHADGLQKAVGILDQVGIRGAAAGKAVRAELSEALAKLSADELPKVEAAAVRAFGAGTREAEAMADAVDRVRLNKLGIDLDAIRTGFSKAGREVTTAFADMVAEIDTLGLTAEQKSAAIAQAFDNAFRQTSTKAELQALKKSLQDALNAGDIGFAEFAQRVAEADAKLAALAGTAASVPDAMADGLKGVGNKVREVADSAVDATERMADGVDKVGKASEVAADDVGKFDVALTGLNDNLIEAYFATNRYVNTIDSGIWSQAMNRITAMYNEQAASLARMNAEMDAQLAKYDPLAEEMEKLKAQYPYLQEAQLRATAEKSKRLEDEKQRATDEAKRMRAEARAEREAAGKESQGGQGAAPSGNGPVQSAITRRVAIDVTAGDQSASFEVPEDQEHAALSVMELLARSRSITTRRRR